MGSTRTVTGYITRHGVGVWEARPDADGQPRKAKYIDIYLSIPGGGHDDERRRRYFMNDNMSDRQRQFIERALEACGFNVADKATFKSQLGNQNAIAGNKVTVTLEMKPGKNGRMYEEVVYINQYRPKNSNGDAPAPESRSKEDKAAVEDILSTFGGVVESDVPVDALGEPDNGELF